MARQDGGKLKAFPTQCCDIAKRVLGLRLYDAGLRDFAEHLANAEDDRLHRWLDVGGLVVDVTADQFGEPLVIVSRESRWRLARLVQEQIVFDEQRVDLLRSAAMAECTRRILVAVHEICE